MHICYKSTLWDLTSYMFCVPAPRRHPFSEVKKNQIPSQRNIDKNSIPYLIYIICKQAERWLLNTSFKSVALLNRPLKPYTPPPLAESIKRTLDSQGFKSKGKWVRSNKLPLKKMGGVYQENEVGLAQIPTLFSKYLWI